MSIRAVNWALDVCAEIDAPARCRMVLFVLAVHHHDKKNACFPSYDTISNLTGYRRRGVIEIVDELEANGLIFRQKRRVGGHQSSNNFVLFGRPTGKRWLESRVQKKAPSQSADGGTLTRVRTGAPDKEDIYYLDEGLPFRLVIGGRSDV